MTVRVVIKWKPEAPPPVVAAAVKASATAKVAQPQRQIQRSHARVPVNYRFSIYANQPEAKTAEHDSSRHKHE